MFRHSWCIAGTRVVVLVILALDFWPRSLARLAEDLGDAQLQTDYHGLMGACSPMNHHLTAQLTVPCSFTRCRRTLADAPNLITLVEQT